MFGFDNGKPAKNLSAIINLKEKDRHAPKGKIFPGGNGSAILVGPISWPQIFRIF
jgi:hypothetical protein